MMVMNDSCIQLKPKVGLLSGKGQVQYRVRGCPSNWEIPAGRLDQRPLITR